MFRPWILLTAVLLLATAPIQAAPPQPSPDTSSPGAQARSDTLYLFAAEGPGSFGSPGTDARGFTFDGPGGGPEPAGWFGVDLRAQELHWQIAPTSLCAGTGTDMSEAAPFDTLDTVNDFALWCGTEGPCDWVDPHGYGNHWDQYVVLELGAAPVQADIAIEFAYSTDFEGGEWDYLEVGSFHDGDWHWPWYDNTQGDRTYREVEVVLPDYYLQMDSLRLAFRFQSDGGWSDQDGQYLSDLGAVWLDNIRVSQRGSVLFESDFESGELQPELRLEHGESTGDYSNLYQGLFQGDADPVNESFVWAFFDSSTMSFYDPEYEFAIAWGPPYLKNAIESPRLSVDSTGAPVSLGPATRVLLGFDVYLDMNIIDLIFYAWYIGGVMVGSGNCDPWFKNNNIVSYGDDRIWVTLVRDVTEEFRESAGGAPWNVESIVARLAVMDMTDVWYHDHHEHRNQAPYFDNVRVMLVEGDLTSAPPAPALPSLAAFPNPFNPTVELRLSMPNAGRCTLTLHDIAGRRVVTLIDEELPAGERRLTWDGVDEDGSRLPSGVYLARAVGAGGEAGLKVVLLK